MQSNIKVQQSCLGFCFQSSSQLLFLNIYIFKKIGAGVGAGGAFLGTGVERLRHSVCVLASQGLNTK